MANALIAAMPSIPTTVPPKLAPPGAGLPKLELMVARLIFRLALRRSSRDKSAAAFSLHHREILRFANNFDAATLGQRVLIDRLRGLEDSSRYWSVFMTLDHLRIVNDAIADAITALVAGQVPPRAASTAAVKPDPAADGRVVATFEESCRNLAQCVAAAPDLHTRVKYAHPWFGPLDAASWHFLAGFHMNLHRRQIEAILAGPPNSGGSIG
jgi:DinB superfamily